MNSPSLLQDIFLRITQLMEGDLLKAPVEQSAEEFLSLLTPYGSRKHERQKEEEENPRGALKTSCWTSALEFFSLPWSKCVVAQQSPVKRHLSKRTDGEACTWATELALPVPRSTMWHHHHPYSALWVNSAPSRWKGYSWQAQDDFSGLWKDSRSLP